MARLFACSVIIGALIGISPLLSAADFQVNAIQAPMEDHLRITADSGLEFTRPNKTIIGIPRAMISGVVITNSRAYIQTLPFPLITGEEDNPTVKNEPLTFIVLFDLREREMFVKKFKNLY